MGDDCAGAGAGRAEARNMKPSAIRSGKSLRRGGTTDVSRADKKYVQNETPRLDRTPVTTGSALDHAPTSQVSGLDAMAPTNSNLTTTGIRQFELLSDLT